MKSFYSIAAFMAGFALSSAQITTNPDGNITCPATPTNGSYCAGDSLKTNIIVRCAGTKGNPGNCNDNLAGVPPAGVKTSATCWQSSPTAGDAACSFNGIVYAQNGSFPVPGGSGSSPPYTNTTTTSSGSTSTTSSTTLVTVCNSCTTTMPGGATVTGPSTFTAVVTPTGGSGGSSGGSATGGAGASPTLAGNDASAMDGRTGVAVGAIAGLLAWALI